MREIARDLALSPGNGSYRSPTKEALVSALIREGHAANNALVEAPSGPASFEQVDAIVRALMRRDLENRWLLPDYVGLLVALPGAAPAPRRDTARARRASTRSSRA